MNPNGYHLCEIWMDYQMCNNVGLIKGLVPKNTRIWKKKSVEKPRTEAFQTSKDNKSEHKELEDHEKPSI